MEVLLKSLTAQHHFGHLVGEYSIRLTSMAEYLRVSCVNMSLGCRRQGRQEKRPAESTCSSSGAPLASVRSESRGECFWHPLVSHLHTFKRNQTSSLLTAGPQIAVHHKSHFMGISGSKLLDAWPSQILCPGVRNGIHTLVGSCF